MKIWIICVGEPLPDKKNETRLRRMGNLAEKLSQDKNNEVEWFSSTFDHYQKIQLKNSTHTLDMKSNYHVHMIYHQGYKRNISLDRVKFHKNTAKKMYEFMIKKDKPDIIIASMEPLEIAECAVSYGRGNRVPVIVDVRDLWPEIYYEVFPKLLYPLLIPYVKFNQYKLSWIMKNTYSIFGLSNSFLDYGLKYAQRERRDMDAVIPIAYPDYDYQSSRRNFNLMWSDFGLSDKDFILVFLGNFGDQFEFDSIIEASLKAYKTNPDIKFVLCGTGKNIDIIKEKVYENVIFPGWIYQKSIESLLAVSKMGIAPYINSKNYRNNTPNKFGEYLSASMPILVSVSGDMENLLRRANCGFRYKSGDDLYQRIIYYYENTEILNVHSINARKLYEEMFEINKVYSEMISTINYVCKKYKKEG